jgi:putative ABC transport system permease protein
VLLFTLGLVASITLLFGSSPAAYLVRSSLSANLLHAGRDGARGRMGRRSRGWLVGVEVALSVVLLVGAGLLLKTFGKLYAVDLGFQTQGIVRFNLSLPGVRYAELQEVRSFFRTLEDRLSVLPGVESVGSVYGAPLGDAHTTSVVLVAGRPEPQPGRETYAAIRAVSPGYLETLRIPLVDGRGLEHSDDVGTHPVGVVNQAFIRENFSGEDPMGQRVRIKTDMGYGSPYWTIVGVVGDIRSHALTREPVPEIYVPHGQFGPGYMSVNVRAGLDPETLLPSIRAAVRSLDPKLPLQAVETVVDAVRREVAPTRFYLLALGLFAALALALAAVGLYGVLGYVVSQRTREIGVRVALGAARGEIVRMVVSDGLRPALAGIVAGLTVALLAGRVMETLLYDVASRDPITLTSAPVVVLGVAVLAILAPARRASRVDPVSMLRAE